MSAAAHRVHCQLHFDARVQERALALSDADTAALAENIERLRPCWWVVGRDRYRLTTRHRGRRIQLIYDSSLRTLVSAWEVYRYRWEERV